MRASKKYLVTLIVGFVCVLGILLLKDFFHQTETVMIFHILCDAFSVAGILLLCIGLMIFSTNEGTFDGLVYGVKSFVDLFRRDGEKKYDNYYDYKAQNSKKKAEFGYLLICGLFFIAVSLVMLYFYHIHA